MSLGPRNPIEPHSADVDICVVATRLTRQPRSENLPSASFPELRRTAGHCYRKPLLQQRMHAPGKSDGEHAISTGSGPFVDRLRSTPANNGESWPDRGSNISTGKSYCNAGSPRGSAPATVSTEGRVSQKPDKWCSRATGGFPSTLSPQDFGESSSSVTRIPELRNGNGCEDNPAVVHSIVRRRKTSQGVWFGSTYACSVLGPFTASTGTWRLIAHCWYCCVATSTETMSTRNLVQKLFAHPGIGQTLLTRSLSSECQDETSS